MTDLIELSRQSPSSLSPWEPSVLLQLWNPDAQGWSCLGWTQAGRRCRRVLSQAKGEAIMRTLSHLGPSEPKDTDLETNLFSQLSHECLCRDHDDDDTAQALVGQWKTAFQKARSRYQKTQGTPSKESSSIDSKHIIGRLSAEKGTQSPDTSTRSSLTPAGDSASKSHDKNTQLKSPPLSSRESEGKALVSPQDSRKSPAALQEEGSVEQPTPAEPKSPSKFDFSKPASPLAEKTPAKLDFSAPFLGTTPFKSPEISKSTPSFDFTQLFKPPGSRKPTVNPRKSTPAPASFKFDQPKTPSTSSTADRSYFSVPSLSPSENSPSFVFSSSSTPSKPPANKEEELPSFEDRLRDMQQRRSLESQRRWPKDPRESVDGQSSFLTVHGDSKDKVDEKVLRESKDDITGLGESIEKLRLQLHQGGTPTVTKKGAEEVGKGAHTKQEVSLRDAGSHADSEGEDEASGRAGQSEKEEGERVGSMFDFSFQTPKAASGGQGAGGQSKFDFVFSSRGIPK